MTTKAELDVQQASLRKSCTQCGIDKPYPAFNIDMRTKNGRRGPCMACELLYSQQHRNVEQPARILGDNASNTTRSPQDALLNAPAIVKPGIPIGNLDAVIAQRVTLYRCCALDALYDLAMMPISTNSVMNNVKYAAACRLAGAISEPPPAGSALDDMLKKLNADYHEKAPRIKSVRERVVTFESAEKVIEG